MNSITRLLSILMLLSAGALYAMENPNTQSHYGLLGATQATNAATLKKLYRKLAMQWHPDKNSDNKDEANKKFQAISEAYSVLSDPLKRRDYDREREFNASYQESDPQPRTEQPTPTYPTAQEYRYEPASHQQTISAQESYQVLKALFNELKAQMAYGTLCEDEYYDFMDYCEVFQEEYGDHSYAAQTKKLTELISLLRESILDTEIKGLEELLAGDSDCDSFYDESNEFYDEFYEELEELKSKSCMKNAERKQLAGRFFAEARELIRTIVRYRSMGNTKFANEKMAYLQDIMLVLTNQQLEEIMKMMSDLN